MRAASTGCCPPPARAPATASPHRAEQRQLRRPDLLGRRDLDVPGPAAHPPRPRQVHRRVPLQDHARRPRERARLGYPGLFYPWTSASKGDLWSECHSWDPPHCRTQIHLQSDIALAAWQYYLATGDTAGCAGAAGRCSRASPSSGPAASPRNADGSYSINDVAGPDEYSNGVDDAVFTNAGAATALRNATRAAQVLGEPAPRLDRDRGQAPHPVRREQAGLRAVRRLQGHPDQAGGHGAAHVSAGVADVREVAAATLDYYAARTDPDGPAMTDSVHAIDAARSASPAARPTLI